MTAPSRLNPEPSKWIHMEMVAAKHGEEVSQRLGSLGPRHLNRLAVFISTRVLSIPQLPGEHLGIPTTTWRETVELHVAADEGLDIELCDVLIKC